MPSPSPLKCQLLCRQLSPRARDAERYGLLRKLTVTEPGADTLELCFDTMGKGGAERLAQEGGRRARAARRLQQVSISPCAATELKARPLQLSHASSSRAVATQPSLSCYSVYISDKKRAQGMQTAYENTTVSGCKEGHQSGDDSQVTWLWCRVL